MPFVCGYPLPDLICAISFLSERREKGTARCEFASLLQLALFAVTHLYFCRERSHPFFFEFYQSGTLHSLFFLLRVRLGLLRGGELLEGNRGENWGLALKRGDLGLFTYTLALKNDSKRGEE